MQAPFRIRLRRFWTRVRAFLDLALPGVRGYGPAWALPGGGRRIVVAGIGSLGEAAEAGPAFRPSLYRVCMEYVRNKDARLLPRKIMSQADAETSEILFLLYLEGLAREEAVERMGISRSTVHRNVIDFKARMGKHR